MKLKSYISLLAIASFLSACAHGFYYRPDPTAEEHNDTFISNGVTYAVSVKHSTEVAIMAMKPAKGQLQLGVIYKNNLYDRVNALPTQIHVYALGNKDPTPLKIYSANQYLNKLQRRQNSQMTAIAISDAINNTNAGYSASSTTGSAVSSNGNYVVGTSTTGTYDASKVSEANYRSDQEMNQLASNFYRYKQSMSERLIRDNTLLKGQSIQGIVIVNTSKSFDDKIYISIQFGNDTHSFMLMPNK